jgi:Lon protease-like protein
MQTRTLPLFPLPLVLYPGTTQALHIFEPRYRQLLADCQSGDGQFGISPVVDDANSEPLIGSVGCTAVIQSVVSLPDGRSNIVIAGTERYTVADYVDSDRLYLVAEIVAVNDEPWRDEDVVRTRASEVRTAFSRYRAAVRQLPDHPDIPPPPDDPAGLSFVIASALPVDLRLKLHLLELRSTLTRLTTLLDVLDPVTESVIQQARLQRRAKRNGRRPLTPGGTA